MRPSMGAQLTVDPPPFPFACRRPVEEEDSYESSLESYILTALDSEAVTAICDAKLRTTDIEAATSSTLH
ncbi:hypothetical protein CUMW_207420, partial [Citrus unshiu]